ncbi:MAG: YggS family pyridoxal phosphate-dependent enzyme [Planctomycetes bacterium]|jgi:pyridoxal phosphate enzyme (YggS family)|nr:YggS family pyridoxal phosphate-dependent enzyme [Planctomycetota bacterium]MCP4838676.1 YggS family pyridoxal phosphate-dependent enzyme [Planctomycetota bacterium]
MTNSGPDDVAGRYEEVRDRIRVAAERGGHDPKRVFLVAVTKNATPSQVRILHRMGQVDFGESRMQHFVRMASQIDEFRSRQQELHAGGDLPESIRWHFIGHLQRNKVRRVLSTARLVHSIDSLKLAEEIQAAHRDDEPSTEILIQVNISGERSKQGIAPAATPHLVDQVQTMLGVRVRGLMCMAPKTEDLDEVRQVFRRGRELFSEVRQVVAGDSFNLLSMGMSNDYEIAVECGANVVRVGRAIFGDGTESEATTEATAAGT